MDPRAEQFWIAAIAWVAVHPAFDQKPAFVGTGAYWRLVNAKFDQLCAYAALPPAYLRRQLIIDDLKSLCGCTSV